MIMFNLFRPKVDSKEELLSHTSILNVSIVT
jgi:hypothetical protein